MAPRSLPRAPGPPPRAFPALPESRSSTVRRGRGPTRLRPPLDVLTGGSRRGAVPRARRCARHPQQRPWSPGMSSASPLYSCDTGGRARKKKAGRWTGDPTGQPLPTCPAGPTRVKWRWDPREPPSRQGSVLPEYAFGVALSPAWPSRWAGPVRCGAMLHPVHSIGITPLPLSFFFF